jgi:hypothetical protein
MNMKIENYSHGIIAYFGLDRDNRQINIIIDKPPSKIYRGDINLDNYFDVSFLEE